MDVELPLAGPGGRSYAFIIDWHIRLIAALLWMAIVLLLAGVLTDSMSQAVWVRVLAFGPPAVIYLLYHPILELAMGGQTPGKRIAGVRVVTRAGQPPSVGVILIRNVFRLVDSLPAFYTVGLLSTIVTRDSVRIGDLAAGTVLVTLPGGSRKLAEQRQAVLATQTRLQPGEAELVADVLERWAQLTPSTRRELARRLLRRPAATGDDEHLSDDDLRAALQDLLVPRV